MSRSLSGAMHRGSTEEQKKRKTTGRKCINILYQNTEKEKVCGKSTGKNWFFCKECLRDIDDYGTVSGTTL